jgi:hypothetical protein
MIILDILDCLFFTTKPRYNKKFIKNVHINDNDFNHNPNILYNKNNKYDKMPRYIIFPNKNKRLYIKYILFV